MLRNKSYIILGISIAIALLFIGARSSRQRISIVNGDIYINDQKFTSASPIDSVLKAMGTPDSIHRYQHPCFHDGYMCTENGHDERHFYSRGLELSYCNKHSLWRNWRLDLKNGPSQSFDFFIENVPIGSKTNSKELSRIFIEKQEPDSNKYYHMKIRSGWVTLYYDKRFGGVQYIFFEFPQH